jgi:hypothetical protein
MLALMEVPGDPEMGLLQVMLAEHGPGGVITILVVVFIWKVAIPGLNAAGKMARELFDQHLKQGGEVLERLASLESAVKAGDVHNAAKLDSMQRGLEASLGAATAHMRVHDREIENLKQGFDGHEHRIRAVELTHNSGAYKRPPPPKRGD